MSVRVILGHIKYNIVYYYYFVILIITFCYVMVYMLRYGIYHYFVYIIVFVYTSFYVVCWILLVYLGLFCNLPTLNKLNKKK